MSVKPQTIDLPALSMRAAVGASSANEDERTVDVTFSTGAGVERVDWMTGKRYLEVLSMDPAHIRLERLNAGAPVLDSHSAWSVGDVLGAVKQGSARIEHGLGLATLRFSHRPDVEPIWQDVRDQIIGNVSVGYRVYKFVETQKDGQIPTRLAIDWEPFEISMVPMPADAGARVRNGDRSDTNTCVILTRETSSMENEQTTTTETAVQPPAEQRAAATATPGPTADQVREQATIAERARMTGITDAVRLAGLDSQFAADLVRQGVTLDAARAAIFARMAERSTQQLSPNSGRVEIGGDDARDKWLRGAMNWLLVRSGMASLVAKHDGVTVDKLDPGEFRGMTLIDLARESLTRHNVSVRGLDRMTLAGNAMAYRNATSYQTASDFATLLENAMHKVLRASYAMTPDTWSRFCGITTVMDFRDHNWYKLGALSQLDSLNDHGEFKSKAIPDAEKTTYAATTKGNIVGVTRQVIVNDDLGAIMRLFEMLGRAGKLTIEKAVYSLLAQNSGLGPTMDDSIVLFNASHNNISTGAALSAAAIDADRVAMASQMDPNSQEYVDLRPAILLVPVSLGGQARVINQSQYDPDTVANKAQYKPNAVAALFRDIVDTPRLSGTRRYLFADPTIAPVLVVSFLEGQQEPVLESQDGWRFDGTELKARLDFGVDAVDFRGAVTNAGV